jgi:hypothetical protein
METYNKPIIKLEERSMFLDKNMHLKDIKQLIKRIRTSIKLKRY